MDSADRFDNTTPPPTATDTPAAEDGPTVPESPAESALLRERLREALAASIPGLTPEAIRGRTLAEIEESFGAAKAVADGVRIAAAREAVPAISPGAPGRAGYPPATAFEKIRSGLERLSAG